MTKEETVVIEMNVPELKDTPAIEIPAMSQQEIDQALAINAWLRSFQIKLLDKLGIPEEYINVQIGIK